MLPKDLLEHLESEDRSSKWVENSKADVPSNNDIINNFMRLQQVGNLGMGLGQGLANQQALGQMAQTFHSSMPNFGNQIQIGGL